MEKLTRRSFFKAAGATAAALTAKAHALTAGEAEHLHVAEQAPAPAGAVAASTAYIFFRPDEALFVEAAVERLIPADANGPGAREAGVPNYIDRQLGGAWGAGERLYRSGPWQQGTPQQGYQLPFTPAELFRTGLRAVIEEVQRRYRTTFDMLPGPDQDAYLQSLQTGRQSLNGVPANIFFESLLGLTVEGFFSDPVYGGNKDMAAWKMIGFPGAYASYYELVDQHGLLYTRAPVSIGDNGRGVIHVHPVGAQPAAAPPGAHPPAAPADKPRPTKGGK
jgi:gluconate 2-dehydrogenase gamma chain